MTWFDGCPAPPEVDAGRRARLAHDLLDRVGVGYCLLEVRARAGEPVDARFLDLSAALEGWPPLWAARGLWTRHVLPDLDEEVYAMLRVVLVTGEAAEVEVRSALSGGHAVKLHACRLGHPKERLVGVLVRDVSLDASMGCKGR